jgi:hypothetical protein
MNQAFAAELTPLATEELAAMCNLYSATTNRETVRLIAAMSPTPRVTGTVF